MQLPLIPVDEFLQLSPEHARDDEKSLMAVRINHEHAEREALEQARQDLLRTKQSLIADNKKRKDDLASLDKDLETFIDVSKNGCASSHSASVVGADMPKAAKPIQSLFEKQY